MDKKEIKNEVVEKDFVTKDELKSIVEEMSTKIAEAKERREKKFNLSADEKAIKGAENTVKFFKALIDGDKATLKEMAQERISGNKSLGEATGSEGGYLVPAEFEAKVYAFNSGYNQIRSNALVIPMSSMTKELNSLITEPIGYKTSEKAQITASDPAFAEPVLTAQKYGAITPFSEELDEDAEIPFQDLLSQRIARALSKVEQYNFVDDTTSGAEGLRQVSGSTVRALITGTTFASVQWDDLANMLNDLRTIDIDEADDPDTKYYMAPITWNYLLQTKASTAGTYLNATGAQGEPIRRAWGKEVVLCSHLPSTTATGTKFVLLGNLKKHFVIGERRGLKVKLLEEGTVGSDNLGEKDMMALRVTRRTAHVCVLPTGLVWLKTN